MRLYNAEPGFAERLVATAQPSITIRSGISRDLPTIPYWRELLKLKARALAHRAQTQGWLQLLNSHPTFSEYVQNYPRFLYKIYRPYLTNTLPIEARLAVLASHYQFVFQRGLGDLVSQASRGPVVIASSAGKSGERYNVKLRAIGPLEREGELVLQLCAGDETLYSVAFTFAWRGQCQTVNIGCIQGAKGGATLEAIRHATRDLHGARPKHLLVTLVRQLGHAFGCEQLRMVSNANRVVKSAMRQGRVRSDYDQLWIELGAQLQADGDFMLPCAPVAPLDLESIPSKKRSEARKRHELVATLANDVTVRLGGQV
ncbi:DUF535 family protein [Massilia horti]|uniref:DUF535 domain-containing protein n=1 Tax=Massilia horti TaxID=2562153 RepID=A0A4Y9T2T2_9BURK|nr:DUF535 family protein [Massilia horti]TFW33449.1 DUF535 domain-containing protein [Massilia horti]